MAKVPFPSPGGIDDDGKLDELAKVDVLGSWTDRAVEGSWDGLTGGRTGGRPPDAAPEAVKGEESVIREG